MKLNTYLVLFIISVHLCGSSFIVSAVDNNSIIHVTASEFEVTFSNAYKVYVHDGNMSKELEKMINLLKDKIGNTKLIIDDIPKAINPQECLKCRSMTHTILQFNKIITDIDFLNAIANNLCNHVTSIAETVCVGMIKLNSPIIKFIMDQKPNLLADEVCGITFQLYNCGVNEYFPDILLNEINLPIRTLVPPIESRKNLTVVHITDVHYDPYYNPGGNAVCGEGACCRLNQGPPMDPKSAAGKWGDYRDCDSPWEAIVDIVKNIKSQYQNIDYVYFTGDIVDHFSWETTKEGNIESMRKLFQFLKEEFNDIPILPVLGNHESHPGNQYAPHEITDENISNQWLYNFVANEWHSFLPSNALETVRHGGYYTVLIRPGFRIIGLNNNVCYGHNWWLFYNSTFFHDQLHWLDEVLLSAALDNEFVHILGHVPSNDQFCYKGWTKQYRKIIEKYSYIITAQFNGHSHLDEFNVYYSKEDPSVPVNVAWNGASGTTFTYLNPNYRVYYVEPYTHEVLDFDTWIYNLTEANLNSNQSPQWYKEYSFKDAYQIDNMKLSTLDGLLKNFATNKTLLTQYWEYKIKKADPQLSEGCDNNCLLASLCDIVRIEYGDNTKCEEFSKKFWLANQE